MKGPQAVNEVYEVIKYFVVHNEKVREECDIEWGEGIADFFADAVRVFYRK